MVWKKAFLLLFSFNLAVIAGIGLWFDSLPRRTQQMPVSPAAPAGQTAAVNLTVDQDAVNTYLTYALSEQPDLAKVLAYARVQMDTQWQVNLGLQLSDRVVPADVVMIPEVVGGNLRLHMESAEIGSLPVPVDGLFLALKHLPWPAWIDVDSSHSDLVLNVTQRPANPYGVSVLDYDPGKRALTLRVTLQPKVLLPSHSKSPSSS
ncbi:MAG: YpmS family protein [Alicyclobacillus sp.]|nr:YpmS family protein [Alicyclobacillus sp.]